MTFCGYVDIIFMKNLLLLLSFIVIFGCCKEKHFLEHEDNRKILQYDVKDENVVLNLDSHSYKDKGTNENIDAGKIEELPNQINENNKLDNYIYTYLILLFLFLSIILYKTIKRYKLSSYFYFIFISILCFMSS